MATAHPGSGGAMTLPNASGDSLPVPHDAGQKRPGPEDYDPSNSLKREVRIGLGLCGALVVVLGGLGGLLPMTGAVITPGEVVVASHVKQIAHPSGGVVEQILVDDGDRVERGALLVRLDSTISGAASDFTGENVDQLRARAARLLAERDGKASVSFPADLLKRSAQPAIAAALEQERRTLALRREARSAQLAQISQRIEQARAEAMSARGQARSFDNQAALIGEELTATRKLYEDRYTTLDRLNALERSASGLEAETRTARESARSATARIAELQAQARSIEADARSDAASLLLDVEARITELRKSQVEADETFERSAIRAPQAGTVTNLAYRTPGGVIPPGQTILEIVPENDRLLVSARVSPADIDQVHEGQNAVVRLSAFSTRTTPELEGKVTLVAADRKQDERSGAPYYDVRISLPPAEIAKLGELRLRPGMPAESFIQTGERTMLGYILKPLSDQFSRAFREN